MKIGSRTSFLLDFSKNIWNISIFWSYNSRMINQNVNFYTTYTIVWNKHSTKSDTMLFTILLRLGFPFSGSISEVKFRLLIYLGK